MGKFIIPMFQEVITPEFLAGAKAIVDQKPIDTPHDRRWGDQLVLLGAFYLKHQHFNIPSSMLPLKRWCIRQRNLRNEGLLSAERIGRLTAIGFPWCDHKEGLEWQKNYDQMKAIKKSLGHLKIPKENIDLRRWARYQAKAKIRGELSEDCIKMLDDIGFAWVYSNKKEKTEFQEQKWSEYYKELMDFYLSNGHVNVPASYRELYAWCAKQRYAKKTGTISSEHCMLLEKIGCAWSPSNERWLKKYNDFIGRQDPASLAWAANQRRRYHQGKLSEYRIKLLDKIGFEW